MSVTHSLAMRNLITDTVGAAFNVGGAGNLIVRTTGSATSLGTSIATLTLSASAFVTAGQTNGGQASAKAITSDTSAAGGTMGGFSLQSSQGTYVVHGSVATSGTELNFAAGVMTVTVGDTVAVTTLQYTAPA